ncbi:MAG: UvrD-helicase domain-containing protein [Deltaproteobacteria bacterium]|nr:UvrD-helicase domain-containing protein [Deltaproteobacteria bacterium]
MDLLDGLNEAQRAAVVHRGGPLLVFAGAGSGKTRVITRRIAHAVEQRWVDPFSVVALTFTNKAAREMQERVSHLLGGYLQGLTVGTFHSTCAKWLRIYGPRYGHPGDFVIYDSDDQTALVRRLLNEMNYDSAQVTPKLVAQRLDRVKNQGLGPDEVPTGEFGEFERAFPKIYARYEETLQKANALDFGDLVLHMVRLLEKTPDAKQFFNQRFSMVLVDEYQDTNAVQYRLLRALSPPPSPEFCVVGDDDQSIYKFRGADVGNILAFRRDYQDVAVVKLEENYRSVQAILDVSNSVIKNNRRREPKALKATRGGGEAPQLIIHSDEREEAMFVARHAARHVDNGGKLEDIAVLFRQNAQSRVLEEAFSRARIPFLLVGGQRFYERAEVKDALAYLRLLVRPESEIDLVRIINTPARGIGDKTVERMTIAARAANLRLWDIVTAEPRVLQEAGLATGAVDKVLGFSQLMRALKDAAETLAPPHVVSEVLSRSGLLDALKNDESIEAEGRVKNLEELLNAVSEWYGARPDGTLSEYLEELALLADVDAMKGNVPRVTLMTLHSAKGLEFKHVLLLGLEDGIFPVQRPGSDLGGSEMDVEEERRLFYVGVTRAMDKLVLSACQSRLLYGQRQVMDPSRFLFEIPKELLKKAERAAPPQQQRPQQQRFTGMPGRTPQRSLPSGPDASHPALGKRVQHATFGEGKVVEVSNDDGRLKYVVDFQSVGRKTVIAQYVQAIRS